MTEAEMTPEFVEFIPESLEEGVVYVTIPYATVSHLCACGCGNKVVTPLGPADWELIFDGEQLSLFPSIGNWQLPCQSHYWIWRNSVSWAGSWTPEQIKAGRQRDERDLKSYFERRGGTMPPVPTRTLTETTAAASRERKSAPPANDRRHLGRLRRLLRK